MLDAYIIDRIRKERQPREHEREQLPLHIHNPEPRKPQADERDDRSPERGTDVVDYRL